MTLQETPERSDEDTQRHYTIHSQSTGYSRISTPLTTIDISGHTHPLSLIDLTSDSHDIYTRIRNGFSMPNLNNDLVLYHQQWYLNRPDYLRRMLERASPFLYHIVEEIDKRGMPMELALLPMVESAYNPMAYSRAKAAGLWQFIPSTGRHFKLNQDWWKDERRDIVASTAAALEYLQYVYELHGDWHLALASYNWGEGSVGRAMNKNRLAGDPTDYMSLDMPKETQNYVPKLQALKNIFSDPALLAQLKLPNIPNRQYFTTHQKTGNIDIKIAAELAGMPVEEFISLNPAHNRPVIISETPIVIPYDRYDTFLENLSRYEARSKPLSVWQTYTLRPNDKLESVAARFNMSVSTLKAVNGLQGRVKLSPGMTLLVSGTGSGASEIEPIKGQLRLPQYTESSTRSITHTVKKGETLASIAKRYGVTASTLRGTNRLKTDQLSSGMKLTITANTPAKQGATTSPKRSKTTLSPRGKTQKSAPKPKKKG